MRCMLIKLNWILCSNVLYDVDKGIIGSLASLLPPHKFIQIAWQNACMATFHCFELPFAVVPVHLHVLGVSPSGAVHKLHRAVYSIIVCHVWQ